jgi:hypothetical protein
MFQAGAQVGRIYSTVWQSALSWNFSSTGGPYVQNRNCLEATPCYTNNVDLNTGLFVAGTTDTLGLTAGSLGGITCSNSTTDVCYSSFGFAFDPSADQSVADDGTIQCNNNGINRVAGNGGAALLDTDPSISDGTRDGQFCILQGTSDANAVTIAHNTNVDLSNGSSVTLKQGDTLVLIWDSGDSMWYQTPRDSVSDNAAYSSLWAHPNTATVTISTQDTLTAIDSFANVGPEDSSANAVGSAASDTITIGTYGAGVYAISIGASLTTATASRHFKIAACIDLSAAKTITDATNATPIVVTSAGHGLKNGDIVIISGVGGNTAANGSRIATSVTTDTFELEDLDHSDVAGTGAYTTGGTVDTVCPGSLIVDRAVSVTEIGSGSRSGMYQLSSGDAVVAYAANTDSTDNLTLYQITLTANRIDR